MSGEPWDDEMDGQVVPISALEHWSYCPRQCSLIHVEQTYEENVFTIRGTLAHERADAGEETTERGVRAVRGVSLWSERLGLRGKADVVEMRREGPFPIEMKVGKRHGVHADLQLYAQALCLEEMLGVPVPRGAIYSHAARRRYDVTFDDGLRARTLAAIEAVRTMLRTQAVPPAPNDARCPRCSLVSVCLPTVIGERHRLRGLQGALFRAWDGDDRDDGDRDGSDGDDGDVDVDHGTAWIAGAMEDDGVEGS